MPIIQALCNQYILFSFQELQELLSRQTQAENQVAKTREELNNLKEQYRHLQVTQHRQDK